MFSKTIILLLIFTFTNGANIPIGNQDWWKHATFYQIYPRSFRDGNNDGIGDLPGVLEKLPHLLDTGVDAVWLSPIMKSPQVDQGYDISDYYTIDPIFGNIEDLKQLITTAHKHGLKIIMDFVPNHTSDQHDWFKASENGTEGYEDYYVWVDGTPDKLPNNWLSNFGSSAWQWSEKRQQYYLHQFVIQQPDLNYRNPKVHEEMQNVLKYYLDMGVDGFRIDAFNFVYEDKELRDEPRSNTPNVSPTDYDYLDHIYTTNQNETYELIYKWRKFVDDYVLENGGDARVLMTEVYTNLNQTFPYYGTADGSILGAHFTFNFFLVKGFDQNASDASDFVKIVHTWLDQLPKAYIPNWVLGNHDNHRFPNRLGIENKDGFNMLLALLPGIAVTYNGDEFGQEDGEVTYDEGQDPSARNPATFDKVSRDFERTPLQWDNTTNAGFNDGAKPWLPVSNKYHELNLENQLQEGKVSYYHNYWNLIRKRQEYPARIGTTNIWALSNDTIVMTRSYEYQHIVVAFKFGWHNNVQPETVFIPSITCSEGIVALTSVGSSYNVNDTISVQGFVLQPHESLVIDITC